MNTIQEFPTLLSLSLLRLRSPRKPTEKTTERQKKDKDLLKHYGGERRKIWVCLSLNTSPAKLPSHRQFQGDGLQVEKSPNTCKDDGGGGTDGTRESGEDTVPPRPAGRRKTDASLRFIFER